MGYPMIIQPYKYSFAFGEPALLTAQTPLMAHWLLG